MTTIKVRFTQAGFHCWPDAPPHRGYLRVQHRHLFHVEVELEVRHEDREVEMHDLLSSSQRHFRGIVDHQTTDSCEKMARLLAGELQLTRASRFIAVEVWEDGEVGARVTHTPPSQDQEEAGHNLVEGNPTWQRRQGPREDVTNHPPAERALRSDDRADSHSSGPPRQDTIHQPSGADADSSVAGAGAEDLTRRLQSVVDYLIQAKRLTTEAKDLPMPREVLNRAEKFTNLSLEEIADIIKEI